MKDSTTYVENIAHDLRNSLSSLKLTVELLNSSETMSEQDRALVETIESEANAMVKTIKQMEQQLLD